MEIVCLTGGPFAANSYLLGFPEQGSAVVVDPGFLAQELQREALARRLTVRQVLITHGHVDHVLGAMAFGPAEVYFPERDRFLVTGEWAGAAFAPPAGNRDLVGGEVLFLPDGSRVEVLYTPGHSPGEVSFYLPEHGVLFSGDTLFAGSIGRPDLPGGDLHRLLASIRERLCTLPAATRVLSGHGPETTIGRECAENPFLL